MDWITSGVTHKLSVDGHPAYPSKSMYEGALGLNSESANFEFRYEDKEEPVTVPVIGRLVRIKIGDEMYEGEIGEVETDPSKPIGARIVNIRKVER